MDRDRRFESAMLSLANAHAEVAQWRAIADELYVVLMVTAPDPERKPSRAERKWLDRRLAALKAYADATEMDDE